MYSLSTDKVDAPFSIAQFSPCGAHIAGSTTKGDICVWRSQPKNEAIVSAHEQKYNICALAWNPAGNLTYFVLTSNHNIRILHNP